METSSCELPSAGDAELISTSPGVKEPDRSRIGGVHGGPQKGPKVFFEGSGIGEGDGVASTVRRERRGLPRIWIATSDRRFPC
jgi:hypothetical protein